MTTKIRITHEEIQSPWKLIVKNNYDNGMQEITAGNSAVFLLHSLKNITITEVLHQESGETKLASPS